MTLQIKRRLGNGFLWLNKIKATTIKRTLEISESLLGTQNIKMLALDLDGTTLTDNMEMLPDNVKAIKAFKKNDPERNVCIVTGRGYQQAIRFAKQINADYLITGHGATVYEKNGKDYKTYKSFPFPEYESETIYNKIIEYSAENPNLVWHLDTDNIKNSFIINNEMDAVKKANIAFYGKETLGEGILQIQNFKELAEYNLSKNITKVCIEFGTDKNGECQCLQFAQYLQQNNFNFGFTQKTKIEIANFGVNKGDSLSEITKKRGINSNQVIAIGNERNDEPMLIGKGFIGWSVGNGNPSLNVPFLINTNNEPFIPEALKKSNFYFLHRDISQLKKSISDIRPSLQEFFTRAKNNATSSHSLEHSVPSNKDTKDTQAMRSSDSRTM